MKLKSAAIIALAVILSIPATAVAEVQNVKIGGDISVQGIYKEDYTLGGIENNATFNGSLFNPADDKQNYFQSQIRLRVSADVTNNVSGMIEVLNQRDWNNNQAGASGSALITGSTTLGPGAAPTAGNDPYDILLSRAYIQINNPYYEGLTVKLGRQNIEWGKGFVVGGSMVNNPDPSNSLSSDEVTKFNAFDAARVIYTRGPWTFDAIAAKIQEDSVIRGDDENLYGINIGREFNQYDAEGQVYFLGATDATAVTALGEVQNTTNELWTVGVTGTIKPFQRLKLDGEAAFQWGEEGGAGTLPLHQFTPNGYVQQSIRAFAFDARAEYTWLELPWPTVFGAEWVFYSGEEEAEGGHSGAWRPLYRSHFHSFIREFQSLFYMTDVGITPGSTNQHQLMFDFALHPFNNPDLTLFGRWLHFWLDEIPISGRGRTIGDELDVQFEYAYTEDLLFRLRGGLFIPGDYFKTDSQTTNSAGQSATTATENAKLIQAEVLLTF